MREESHGFPHASLATRCPDCATVFRVVPDQLRLSEGWVRCGHCALVFDASRNLVDLDQLPVEASDDEGQALPNAEPLAGAPTAAEALPQEQAAAPAPAPAPVGVSPSPSGSEQGVAPPYRGRSVAARQILLGELIPDPPPAPPAPASTPVGQSELPATVPVPASEQAQEPDQPGDEQATARLTGTQPGHFARDFSDVDAGALHSEPPDTAAAAAQTADLDEELRDVGFVRAADRRTFWQRRSVVSILWLGCGLLVAGLLLQVLAHQSGRLVASVPALERPVAALCRAMACEPMPRQQIESIQIESSTFNRRDDHYLFSVDLRNASDLPLATPALELTLTDLQDGVVVRRVLMPAALGAPAQLAAHALWSGRFTVGVEDAGGQPDAVPVAGYRLLAFYP